MLEYQSISALCAAAEEAGVSLSELVLRDQAEEMELPTEVLYQRMRENLQVMRQAIQAGSMPETRSLSGLTGGDAFKMKRYAQEGGIIGGFMNRSIARALAVSEYNAAMGKVVASPTAGSCGILPGTVVSMLEEGKCTEEAAVMALFTAGAVGMVIAQQASIAGAQGGCQAECGSASAMAAAALVELCGGTHLDNTAKVGLFHIVSEGSVASGVRRIEATTGEVSLNVMSQNQEILFQAAAVFKTNPGELREKAEQTLGELRDMRHAVENFKAREAVGEAGRFLMGAKDVGGLKVLTSTVPDADADRLRKMGDILRDKDSSVVGVLSTVKDGKITFLAVCGKDAVAKGVKAGDIIKAIAPICGGKGGGKSDSAMGGGSDVLKLDDALAAVDNFVADKLGI